MNKIGQRIKDLRRFSGLTQDEVADYVGVKRASVSKWESQGDNSAKPKGENLIRLCQILNTTPNFILYGEENYDDLPFDTNLGAKSGPNTEPAHLPPSKDLPIISWVQAGDRHVAFVENDLDEIETFTTYEKCSKNSYALRVNGESMTSLTGPYSFPPGSIIVVDPDQKGDTTDGVFVIAKENGNDAVTFKQLKYDGAQPYLNPLNPQYQKYFGEFRILGKVIDFRPVRLP